MAYRHAGLAVYRVPPKNPLPGLGQVDDSTTIGLDTLNNLPNSILGGTGTALSSLSSQLAASQLQAGVQSYTASQNSGTLLLIGGVAVVFVMLIAVSGGRH